MADEVTVPFRYALGQYVRYHDTDWRVASRSYTEGTGGHVIEYELLPVPRGRTGKTWASEGDVEAGENTP